MPRKQYLNSATNPQKKLTDNTVFKIQYENKPVFIALFILMLVYIGRIQELFPFLEKFFIGKVAMLSCVLLFSSTHDRTKWHDLREIPQIKYLKLLALWCILSTPLSVWPGISLDFLIEVLFKISVLFIIIILAATNISDITRLLWGLICSAMLLCSQTLLQHRTPDSDRVRVQGSYDQNDLAFVMVMILPLVYFMIKSETGAKRVILIATVFAMVLTIVYTGSRGGFVGLITISLAIALHEREQVGKFLIIAILAGSVVIAATPQTFWDRFESAVDQNDYNYDASDGRVEIWNRGIGFMLANPVLGVGVNAFGVADGLSRGGKGKWSTAHNSFVQIGAELGIPGLIIFIKLILSSFRAIREYRVSGDTNAFPVWLLNGLEVSLFGYVVAGFFLSQAYSMLLYVIIGLTIISSNLLRQQRVQEKTLR